MEHWSNWSGLNIINVVRKVTPQLSSAKLHLLANHQLPKHLPFTVLCRPYDVTVIAQSSCRITNRAKLTTSEDAKLHRREPKMLYKFGNYR